MALTVIHNRPLTGKRFFITNNKNSFQNPNYLKIIDSILSDSNTIRRALVKTDPAHLTPAKQGNDVLGPINRSTLRKLAKEQIADLFLIFRWELQGNKKEANISNEGQTSIPLSLTIRGLVYIAKQEKILSLKPHSVTGAQPSELTQKALNKLATEARKTIRAQKKIISKSY